MLIKDRTRGLTAKNCSLTPTAHAWAELERSVSAALGTYANVHRGAGHHSLASTALFEQARDIVLDYLGLGQEPGHPRRYVVIFCTPRRAEMLKTQLKPGSYHSLSSQDIGLPLGVTALAVLRRALPTGAPFQTGGGTATLVSSHWTIWADAPAKFEAGTPAIVNVIALAAALRIVQRYGRGIFQMGTGESQTAAEGVAAEILYHDGLDAHTGRELLEQLRHVLMGHGVRVPTTLGAKPLINLDNAASTPTFLPIWDAVRRAWRQPEPIQREIVQEVKSVCADFLGAPRREYEVIFTSNTTEALNLVAENLDLESDTESEPVVLNTVLEHNSNELPWRAVRGVSLLRLPVDAEGFVDLNELEARLQEYNRDHRHGRQRINLVAVSGASNVLGVFNDLAAISRVVHQWGAHLLVDGAQLIAHRQVNMMRCGIDYLAFSAHKVYAPFGSGALVVRRGLLTFGPACLQRIIDSGEENVGGIAGLGKALVLLQRIGLGIITKAEEALTAHTLRGLARIPGLQLYGVQDPDSPSFAHKGAVIAFSLKGVPHNLVAQELAEHGGIGVRDGCFCAHLLVKHLLKIHPLRARFADLGVILFPELASAVLPGLVRVSLGLENDAEEIDALVRVLDRIARQPRSWSDRLIAALHNGTLLPRTEVRQQMDAFARAAAERVYSRPEPDPALGRALLQNRNGG